jgi:hypothetical protein
MKHLLLLFLINTVLSFPQINYGDNFLEPEDNPLFIVLKVYPASLSK